MTKEERREYDRKRYLERKEQKRIYRHQYYLKHKEEEKERANNYRKEHPEQVKITKQKYRKENKEKINDYNELYNEVYREDLNEKERVRNDRTAKIAEKTSELWTEEETLLLINYYNAGLRLRDIAVILSRTYYSVKCKIKKVRDKSK